MHNGLIIKNKQYAQTTQLHPILNMSAYFYLLSESLENHMHLKDKIEFLENAFAKIRLTFPFINVNFHLSVLSTVNQC